MVSFLKVKYVQVDVAIMAVMAVWLGAGPQTKTELYLYL